MSPSYKKISNNLALRIFFGGVVDLDPTNLSTLRSPRLSLSSRNECQSAQPPARPPRWSPSFMLYHWLSHSSPSTGLVSGRFHPSVSSQRFHLDLFFSHKSCIPPKFSLASQLSNCFAQATPL